jgi:MFS-type transporter involved in bile tolerance (Atg22 family)
LLVFPYIRYAEKQGKLRLPTWGGWGFMVVGFLIHLTGGIGKWGLYMTGGTFFLGYTLFQSLLPAFLTQRVPPENRGSATGFYNLASFSGASLGGVLAGVLYYFNQKLPFALGLVFLVIWPLISLPNPPNLDTTR